MTDSFKEKLHSLSFPRKLGATERKPVQNEDTGRFDGGYHDVHWDGSQDAHVVPESVSYKVVQNGAGEIEPRE